MATFTKRYHRESYEAISTETESNWQAGRTILINGGSEGIGFTIAKAFVAARAASVIILGRRKDTLDMAVNSLRSTSISGTRVSGSVCDFTSDLEVHSLWRDFVERNIFVDVLVLNAGDARTGSLLDGLSRTWAAFDTNVLANLRMAQLFLAQASDDRSNALIHISSFMAHSNPAPDQGAYSASKAAIANLFQHLAEEVPVEKAQIINVHPGAILTSAAERHGYDENTLPWDSDDVPGHFCVWASTKAATFLHGRLVWANWDVNELQAREEELKKEPGLLKIGLQGCKIITSGQANDCSE
ncbi:NAD(P)-binding protein [Rhizodiscina lignyota]|uniref:NAD(P)-binding protein n=1 Tax=Rhizodiscina lignyota TaxID=1504668 RepID=A0A9P4MEF9_9PEZI|nr:NAD(P)-binding protein [Rhizodiscina lignyota]